MSSDHKILHQKQKKIGRNFNSFKRCSSIFGIKAAGLLILPDAWCPPFIAFSKSHFHEWKRNRWINLEPNQAEISEWMTFARDSECNGFIVRSSGVSETLKDRGAHLSVKLSSEADLRHVTEAMAKIFLHCENINAADSMAIVLQVFVKPELYGHLSNEIHVSPSRNRWKYETEYPNWAPLKGFNSRNAPVPDSSRSMRAGSAMPHQALRGLGRWVNSAVRPRSHLEWVVGNGQLWAVQLDPEWSDFDHGVDPDEVVIADVNRWPEPERAKTFELYEVGEATRWKKLKNLDEFDFQEDRPKPKLFFATASNIHQVISSGRKEELSREIESLTAGRAVIRTEIDCSGSSWFNLPRTDTVSGEEAVQWLDEQIPALKEKQDNLDNIAFILHAFIPARAAAWAYARPGDSIALVDTLWGLPDGLQVLPHDSFQIDVRRSKIVSERTRFKPRFLCEQQDGTWSYVDVVRSKARHRSLAASDIIEIGRRTARIAESLKAEAQIMWFCGIPDEYRVGKNLPWYRAREQADPAPRVEMRHKPFDVHNWGDFENVPDSPFTVRLDPEAELIRDDTFLDKVIELAKQRRAPVELQGSLLSHTYYRLSSAGVAVILAEPHAKFFRTRGRQIFGKLVRDGIPEDIEAGGELVREARLIQSDSLRGLAAKLLEELCEVLSANNVNAKREELADVLEVVRGMASVASVPWHDIEQVAQHKASKRGGFLERKVLLETALPMPGSRVRAISTVHLHELAHWYRQGSNLHIPFTSLLASPEGLKFDSELDGQKLQCCLKMSKGELVFNVQKKTDNEKVENQLDLFRTK